MKASKLSAALCAALDEIERELDCIRPTQEDDQIAILVARHAVKAARAGNKGVAAAAVLPSGKIIVRKNQRYFPTPLNVAHAEHNLVKVLDGACARGTVTAPVTVVSSLEPCSKCLPQLISCKPVISVLYVTPDHRGGQVEAHDGDGVLRLERLPPDFLELAACKGRDASGNPVGMRIGRADCADRLRELCWRIFNVSSQEGKAKGRLAPDQQAALNSALRDRTWHTMLRGGCPCCNRTTERRCA
jgi:tRNA(Arg) A34 adenosine deaminase TadA